MQTVTNKQLIEYLKSSRVGAFQGVQRLKRIYRPVICPFDTVINLIPEHQRVLDIGCGTAAFLQVVAEFRNPLSLGAIEIDRSLIERSRAALQFLFPDMPKRLEAYNGVNLPSWIEDYNYVLLIDVLHHIRRERHEEFLATLLSRITPDTTVIIKDMDATRPFSCFFNKVHDLVMSRQFTYERGVGDVLTSLQQLGYQVLNVMTQRMYVYPHYTLVCRKA